MKIIQITSPCQHSVPDSLDNLCQQILTIDHLRNSFCIWKSIFENIPKHLQRITYFFVKNLVKYKKLRISQIAIASKYGLQRETINRQIKELMRMGILCSEKGSWKVSNTYHLHEDLYIPSLQRELSCLIPPFRTSVPMDITLLRSYKGTNSLSYLLNNYISPKEAFAAMGISPDLVKTGIFFGLEFKDMLKLAAFPTECFAWAYEKFALNSRLAKWKPPKERRKAFYFLRKTVIKKSLNWLLAMCFLYCQWNDLKPNWEIYYKLVDVQDSLVSFHSYHSRSSAARSPKMFIKTDSRITGYSPYEPFIPQKVEKEETHVHNNKLLERYQSDSQWRESLKILGISLDELLKPSTKKG